MALTNKRYTTADNQLQEMQAYLMALAAEVQTATPPTDPFHRPCHAAMKAADAVENLRYLLAIAEARRQVSDRQKKPGPDVSQKTKTAAWEQVPAVKWLTGLLG